MTSVQSPPPKGPSAPVKPSRATPARQHDAFDELTAMFLTEPDRKAPMQAQPQAEPRSTIEMVIPGHLPVRGNLWLAPYADAVAQECGPTALMRVDAEDEFSLQILRGSRLSINVAGSSMADIVRAVGPATAAWLVRPASPLDFPSLVASGASRITILSSVDDMAVVAAYRLIKDLAAAAEKHNVELAPIAIAVVGADEAAAMQMIERLNQTTASFLDTRVRLRMCLQRIGAGVQCTQHLTFSGEPCPSPRDIVEMISAAAVSGEPASPAAPPTPQPASPPPPPTDSPAPRLRLAAHDGDEAAEPDAGQPARAVKIAPKPAMKHDARELASANERMQSLARHVPGLTALQPRCPGHEQVELAVDSAGSLHLLSREDSLRELHVVKTWATAHRELLAMACPKQMIASTGAVHCHVFTSSPASVADLHGADLHLHVLAEVQVGNQSAWYAAPLNRP